MVTGHVGKPSKTKGYNTIVLEYGCDPVTGRRDRRERRLRRSNGDDGRLEPFTEAEAEETLGRVLAEIRVGVYVEPSSMTVGRWFEQWFEDHKGEFAHKTRRAYEAEIRLRVVPALGQMLVGDVKPLHFQRLLRKLSREGRKDGRGGLSPKSVHLTWTVIKQGWRELVALEIVPTDATAPVRAPKLKEPERRPLDPEGIGLFLEANLEHPDRDLNLFLLLQGYRLGEALGLSWPNVDRERRVIYVRKKLIKEGRFELFDDPKTEAGRREMPYDDLVAEILDSTWRRRAENKLRLGPAYNDRGLVFCRDDGEPHNPDAYRARFRRLAETIGRPWLRPHNLRHTYITEGLREGIGLRTMQNLAGHANISTTLRYSHVQPGDLEAAAARYESRVRRQMGGNSSKTRS